MPSRFERLAPSSVEFRPLEEHVEIVAAALVWSTARDNPFVDAFIKILEEQGEYEVRSGS